MRAIPAGIDVVHYNAAISSCGKGREWQMSLLLLTEMSSAKINSDVITYNTAISACERGQQWQLAVGLLEEMAVAKVERDVIT